MFHGKKRLPPIFSNFLDFSHHSAHFSKKKIIRFRPPPPPPPKFPYIVTQKIPVRKTSELHFSISQPFLSPKSSSCHKWISYIPLDNYILWIKSGIWTRTCHVKQWPSLQVVTRRKILLSVSARTWQEPQPRSSPIFCLWQPRSPHSPSPAGAFTSYGCQPLHLSGSWCSYIFSSCRHLCLKLELPIALFSWAFSFRKPVPRALAGDQKLQRREERKIRQQAEASRKENERQMKHSVLLVEYLHNSSQPTMLPLQDIKTWPTLNLSQIPSLAEQLGLPDLSDFSLFDPQNTIWINTNDEPCIAGVIGWPAPWPRDLSVDTSLYIVRPSSAFPPASSSQWPARGTSAHSTASSSN